MQMQKVNILFMQKQFRIPTSFRESFRVTFVFSFACLPSTMKMYIGKKCSICNFCLCQTRFSVTAARYAIEIQK